MELSLLADVHRPAEPGKYPVLVAASPYPRQIQNLGAPAGFIEAGATDFFVPRGYVHVIANCRGTSGSGGTFGFFDSQERRDMYDLVEWAAQQPWSDGNVGMIGISYFAGTQMEAAVERPPHLKAIMPIAGTFDLYESATHHGLMSSGFLTPFLYMIGMTSGHTNKLWRSKLMDAMRALLLTPGIHKKFETANGEAAIAGLKVLLKLHHDPHPWDDLWRAIAAEHPFRDAWWEDRNLLPLLDRDRDASLYRMRLAECAAASAAHLHSLRAADQQQASAGCHDGRAWPRLALGESSHRSARLVRPVAQGAETRAFSTAHTFDTSCPEAEGWRTTDTWPIPEATHHAYALRADGALSEDEGEAGSRTYMNLGGGLNRPRPSETDPPAFLQWTTPPLHHDLDLIGPIELQLDAACTAPDTAFIAVLQDVDEQGERNECDGGLSAGRLAGSGRGRQQARRPCSAVPNV